MRHFIRLCCVVLLGTLSACFELREEITLDRNGSGTYSLLLDMSQSKVMIDKAQAMQAEKDPSAARALYGSIDSTFMKSAARIKRLSGISNVRDSVNKSDYVFGITFRFADMNALNRVIEELNTDRESGIGQPNLPIYTWKKGVWERNNDFYLYSVAADIQQQTAKDPEKQRQFYTLLQGAEYVTITRFDGKIKKFSHPAGETDYTKSTLRVAVPLIDAVENKVALRQTIKVR